MHSDIRVQSEPLDVAAEWAGLADGDPGTGGVATFVGLMRDSNDGSRVSGMTLEHYPGMTEKALQRIAEEASSRWPLRMIRIRHRIGEIRPTEAIVFVAVAGAHRAEAFSACEFIMDFLKTQAPFWKREQLADGGSRWVEARSSDDSATQRWEP